MSALCAFASPGCRSRWSQNLLTFEPGIMRALRAFAFVNGHENQEASEVHSLSQWGPVATERKRPKLYFPLLPRWGSR